MSIFLIGDGLTSQTARVDSKGRLKTFAVTESGAIDSSLSGNTFLLTTGTINLSSDSDSWLLYGKNNDDVSWIVDSLTSVIGTSDVTGDFFQLFNVGASEGTLVSAGTASAGINLNIGSATQLAIDLRIGQEGSTLTNGAEIPPSLMVKTQDVREFVSGPIVIPPGVSFATGITPPTGNTDMNVALNLTIYRARNS